MDLNDRARGSGSRNPRGGAGGGTGNTIKGPHSALTDYLQEIGVSRHFRERRRAETAAAAAAAAAQGQAQAQGQEQQPAATLEQQPTASRGGEGADSADAALARDLQDEENEEAEMADSGVGSSRMTTRHASRQHTVVAAAPVAAVVTTEIPEDTGKGKRAAKGKGAAKGKDKKKKKKDSDSEADSDENSDEADQRVGLNRSSARKGGRMKQCEVCDKRFLLRGEHEESERLLCPNCRRSIDRSQNEAAAVSKRAHAVTSSTAVPKRRRLKKTADGLLELEAGLPSLQDLCVRAIAKHVDQVESFGDISVQSLNKLCRIICKMRVLDEHTLGLFLGADRTSVVLYDCTRLTKDALARIVEMSPSVQTLALEYCGRLDAGVLDAFGVGLGQLASVQLEGAFLVDDKAWARFFRLAGPRLRSFQVRFSGFGPVAMRALITHCQGLEELRVSECTDFNGDCLGMLAAPLTETEEALQEPERLLRDSQSGGVAPWRPLSHLKSLDLGHPHLAMSSSAAMRVIGTLGSQLRVLDLSGFKDIDDDFLLLGLAPHSQHLQELSLAECNSISAEALTRFFAQGAETTMGRGLTRLSLNRCYLLTDAVMHAVVRHSCCSLRSLDLNSVDDNLSEKGLLAFAGHVLPAEEDEVVAASVVKGCPYLEEVDLSWVRCTSDSVMEKVLETCSRLEQVKVYGCPEVTIFAPARPGLSYVGRACDTL